MGQETINEFDGGRVGVLSHVHCGGSRDLGDRATLYWGNLEKRFWLVWVFDVGFVMTRKGT